MICLTEGFYLQIIKKWDLKSMPCIHCWMADGKCSLKERSTSNHLGKKLTFLITFKTLALNCRTNVKINKDVMKMSGNITVQINSRNIFFEFLL